MKSLTPILSVLLLLTACATSTSSDCAANRQAVDRQIQAWQAAVAARDAERLASLYADNAVVMYPSIPRVEGRAAIRKLWSQFFEAVDVTISPTSVDFSEACDTAVELGTYQVRSRGDTSPMVDSGKYVFIWKRIDGQWLGVVDITSSDRRPAPASSGAQAN